MLRWLRAGMWLLLAAPWGPAAAALPEAERGRALSEARAAADRRDHAQALQLYQQLLAAAPSDVALLIEAARAHGWADRNADSAVLYRRALAAAPAQRPTILPPLAWQALWSGEPVAARDLFTEWASTAQGDMLSDALDGLAQSLQALGDQAGALATFTQALALRPDHLRLRRRQAMSLLWNDRHDEAVAALQAAQREAPGDRDIGWALANALNFGGRHRAALRAFEGLGAPTVPGERVDVARAWRWAGYEDRAARLLQDPVDAEAAWLRDWRVARENGPHAFAGVEQSDDRDGLRARAALLGAGLRPRPGATLEFDLRRLALDEGGGSTHAERLQASYRWRLGEATDAAGTWWPQLALRAHHFDGWSPWTWTARTTWLPLDLWRIDAELSRELVETPRAIAERVHVDVLSFGTEHRPDARWTLAASGAALRFDDGSTRLRLLARADHALTLRPRWVVGAELSGFDRVSDGNAGSTDRGYWNPRRYDEWKVYTGWNLELRPWDFSARLSFGRAREVDDSSRSSLGRPDGWELGIGLDLSRALRLRLSAGGTGQGLGLARGDASRNAGYWRRYANLSLNGWF